MGYNSLLAFMTYRAVFSMRTGCTFPQNDSGAGKLQHWFRLVTVQPVQTEAGTWYSMLAQWIEWCLYVQLNYWSEGLHSGRLWHFAWYFSWEMFELQTFDLYNPEHDCTHALYTQTHTHTHAVPPCRCVHVVSSNSAWHQQNWVWSQCGCPL